MKSRSRRLAEKSLAAMLAAIEVYNKPSFAHREDSFAILAVSAWELLLKARILQLDGNRLAALLEYENRPTASGTKTCRYRRRNRSGNHVTIGLFKAFDTLAQHYADALPSALRANLEVLVELRDNSVHFFNPGSSLIYRMHEIAAACVKNYVHASQRWFALDLSDYRIFLMPLAFVGAPALVEGVSLNAEERHFAQYLSQIVPANDDPSDDFNVAVRVEIQVRRSKEAGATPFLLSNDPGAMPVRLDEADIRERFPWSYDNLTQRLQQRYTNFKANEKYHQVRRPLESDPKLCHERYLDPGNPKSGKKRFYNANVLRVFDQHFSRRTVDPAGADGTGAD
jgi:hypothetical protein